MWPWSKIKALENEVASLRKELAVLNMDNDMLRQKMNRMTDRDARGRFKK